MAREVARASMRATATTAFLLNSGHSWAMVAKVANRLEADYWSTLVGGLAFDSNRTLLKYRIRLARRIDCSFDNRNGGLCA